MAAQPLFRARKLVNGMEYDVFPRSALAEALGDADPGDQAVVDGYLYERLED